MARSVLFRALQLLAHADLLRLPLAADERAAHAVRVALSLQGPHCSPAMHIIRQHSLLLKISLCLLPV